jgi:hypothetical protein
MSSKVFISYRRNDHYQARAIHEALCQTLPREHVFMDIDSIPPGRDFRKILKDWVDQCEVLLALISSGWIDESDPNTGRRRLDDRGDFVRIEIGEALARGIPVVPVLIDGTPLPEIDLLPDDLKGLVDRQAEFVEYRTFDTDVKRLIRKLGLSPGVARPNLQRAATLSLVTKRWLASGFFRAAEREVGDGSHPQLLEPGSIWLAQNADPEAREIYEFSAFLVAGKRGCLIYDGKLPASTSIALDRLRVEGKSIIPINVNVMAAALADGNAKVVLADLERGYESKDNLFDTRNAIVDERFLFGRSALLTQVGAALTRGEHVLITGLRKCGKTSFLNILRQHLSSYPVCFVDLQRYDRHIEDWPSALFQLMVHSYDNWGQSNFVNWPASSPESPPTTGTDLESLLNVNHRWHTQRGRSERLVLILDEAERIFPADGEVEEARKYVRAAGALRVVGHSASERPLSIIAADLRPWLNRKNLLPDGSTNPFFNFFQEVPLPLLTQYSVGELVRGIGSAIGVNHVQDAYIDKLFSLSGGHPSITRMIAGATYKSRFKPDELSLKDIDAGLADMAAYDALGFFFRGNLWGLLTDDEKAALRNVAKSSDLQKLASKMARFIGMRTVARYPEASANLKALGLLQNGRIGIGSFHDWILEPGNDEA